MSIEENRNCGCNDNMNDSMNSNMMNAEGRTIDCCEKEEMLQQIRCCDFAITELALYLDTHPQDDKALCLHRKYCKQAKDLKDKYQKVYGPLTINYPCNKWRWLEEPWPSFILEVTIYLQFFMQKNIEIYKIGQASFL